MEKEKQPTRFLDVNNTRGAMLWESGEVNLFTIKQWRPPFILGEAIVGNPTAIGAFVVT